MPYKIIGPVGLLFINSSLLAMLITRGPKKLSPDRNNKKISFEAEKTKKLLEQHEETKKTINFLETGAPANAKTMILRHLGVESEGGYQEAKQIIASPYSDNVPHCGIIFEMPPKSRQIAIRLHERFGQGNDSVTLDKKELPNVANIPQAIRNNYGNRSFIVSPTNWDKFWRIANPTLFGMAGGTFIGSLGTYMHAYNKNDYEAYKKTATLKYEAANQAHNEAYWQKANQVYTESIDNSNAEIKARQTEYANVFMDSFQSDVMDKSHSLRDISKRPYGDAVFDGLRDGGRRVREKQRSEATTDYWSNEIAIDFAAELAGKAASAAISVIPTKAPEWNDVKYGAGLGAAVGGSIGLTYGWSQRNKPVFEGKFKDLTGKEKV